VKDVVTDVRSNLRFSDHVNPARQYVLQVLLDRDQVEQALDIAVHQPLVAKGR
jgi:hypothetical protein